MEVEAQSDPGPNSNASSGTVNDVFDLFQSPDPNRQKPTDKILPPFDEASFDTNQSFQLREMKDKMNQGVSIYPLNFLMNLFWKFKMYSYNFTR